MRGLKARPLVMGILNVTPDSFYDGGRYSSMKEAVEHALKLIDAGADIIDVGGESTRPFAEPISLEEELERVIPVIEAIRSESPETTISVDTYKAKVAQEALEAGADMVNDISGLTFDPEMAGVIANSGAYVVIMHIKGRPRDMQQAPYYIDVIGEIKGFLKRQTAYALEHNIGMEKIIIDPGIGFGKRPQIT
jgi:dihydropteroate synthase